jgi:hypothetical protein
MKKYISVILFAIVPLFYSCVGRQQPDYVPASPVMTALNNGQNWETVLTDTLQNDSIILHARWKRDLLRIKFPMPGQTSYNLTAADVKYFNFDVTGSKVTKTFKLDPTYQNTVTNLVVNTVSPINKYVSGQFKLRLVIDSLGINTDTSGIDTVTFTHGQFIAPYK